MGPAIDAYRAGASITRRNPAYVLLGSVAFATTVPPLLLVTVFPVVGTMVGSFFLWVVVAPLVSAFVLGMAHASLVGSGGTLDAGVRSLREHFPSLAGAFGVIYAVQLVVGFVFVFGSVLLFLFNAEVLATVDAAGRRPDAALGSVLAGALLFVLFALVLSLVVLFFALFLQFVDAAVVVGGESTTSAFGAAWRLFRTDPVSVVGYSVLRVLVALGAGAVVVGLYWLGTLAGSDRIAIGLGALGALVAVPVAGAVTCAAHAAYYHRRVPDRPRGDGSAPDGSTPARPAQPARAPPPGPGATHETDTASETDPLR